MTIRDTYIIDTYTIYLYDQFYMIYLHDLSIWTQGTHGTHGAHGTNGTHGTHGAHGWGRGSRAPPRRPTQGAMETETEKTETTETTNIPTPTTPHAPAPRDEISHSGYANLLTLTKIFQKTPTIVFLAFFPMLPKISQETFWRPQFCRIHQQKYPKRLCNLFLKSWDQTWPPVRPVCSPRHF